MFMIFFFLLLLFRLFPVLLTCHFFLLLVRFVFSLLPLCVFSKPTWLCLLAHAEHPSGIWLLEMVMLWFLDLARICTFGRQWSLAEREQGVCLSL